MTTKCFHCSKWKRATILVDVEDEGKAKNYRLCEDCAAEEDVRTQERLDLARGRFR